MHSSTWKAHERQAARWLGAERNPTSGMNAGHSSSDSLHPHLYIEHKSTKSLTQYGLFLDTKHKAEAEGKTPIIIQRFLRKPGWYVTIHKDDMPVFVSEYLAARGIYLDPEDIPHEACAEED